MTTISTSSTGTISSTGIGSGLDVQSIISQLMAAESTPLTDLQTAASGINTQISAVGQISSLSSTLSDKAQALESPSLWEGVSSSSSDSSSVSADTSAGGATAGSYAVTVQQLAQSQTITSSPLASSDSTLGTGSLTIQLGSYTGGPPATDFTPKTGASAVTIDIGDGDTSLSAIRDKINAANAGVQASIITDANGSRLSIRSTDTGAANGFRITANETTDDGDPSTGLSALAYDPVGGDAQMSLNQSSQNAKATVNGIPIESASNTLTNVSDGLNLTVSKVTSSPVTISLSSNTQAMTSAINDFVSAYNALNTYIHNETKYDAASKTGGPLQGDPTIIGFQYQLRGLITTDSTASSTFSSLSQIGVAVQTDGSLAVDSSKLSTALQNAPEVQKLFAATGSGSGQGIAVGIQTACDAATTSGGRLDSETTGLRAQLQSNSDRQADMQTHLDQEQARYQAQFQALDTQMAQMSALSSYMTQQLSSLSTTA
jgi:flagellar hook-associated protein 2